MPYDQKRRALVGSHDNQPISRRDEFRMVRNKKGLLKKSTPAERACWRLCTKVFKMCGSRFVKQRVFHIAGSISFVVDVYFPKFKVGVEVDGPSHYRKKELERDAWRSQVLKECDGIEIVRFSNKAVLERPAETLERIVEALLKSKKANVYHRNLLKRVWGETTFSKSPRELPYFRAQEHWGPSQS
jgi:very-short-patch-repair endonuclease